MKLIICSTSFLWERKSKTTTIIPFALMTLKYDHWVSVPFLFVPQSLCGCKVWYWLLHIEILVLSLLNCKWKLFSDSSNKFILALCEAEMEKDDQLLNQFFQSRSLAMERIRASQQPLILVASLLDRIPNLAGLARTCEVCCRWL